jgi:integrase/recombinase XerD
MRPNTNRQRQEHDILLDELVEEYLCEIHVAPRTRKNYTEGLEIFQKNMPAKVGDIRLETIEAHIIRYKTGRAEATVAMQIAIIRAFYSWLADNKGFRNIARHIPFGHTTGGYQRCLTKEEYLKIRDADIPQYRKDTVKFLCNTGLRVGAVINLQKSNIVNGFIRYVSKGNKPGSVPMNKTVEDIVRRNPRFEFIRIRTTRAIGRICHYVARDVGIERFTPHQCRHYFATELLNRGVDIFTISKLLNHSSVETTKQYLHWDELRLRGTTDILD